jgi:hypothetical protein
MENIGKNSVIQELFLLITDSLKNLECVANVRYIILTQLSQQQ